MGALHTQETKNMIDTGMINLEQGLIYQLQNNHYPPISLDFLPAAKKAIKYAQSAIDNAEPELWNKVIKLPNGKKLTVSTIIEGMHLSDFLICNEDYL